jgi:hypothetical protein
VLGVWLAWAVLLALVVVTVRRRASARRAWLLLLAYVAMVTALFVVTRLGSTLGSLAGLVPRYLADVVVVAALCVGVALLGLRDGVERGVAEWPVPTVLRAPRAFSVGLVAAIVVTGTIVVGNLWSIKRFNDNWQPKHGRDYLATAQAELAAAPPDTALVDNVVPERVVAGYFYPDNLQSHFFRAAQRQPDFVTAAEQLSMFDDTGRIRPATVEGLDIVPGPADKCGHRVAYGPARRIPLEAPAQDWRWWIHLAYVSSGDSTVTFQLGEATQVFGVRRGLNQIYFQLQAKGDAVQLSIADPGVTLCTRYISVGKVVLKPF